MEASWTIRIVVGGVGFLSLLGYAVIFPRVAVSPDRSLVAYVFLCVGLFLLYILATWLVLHRPSSDRVVLGMILGFGLLFRLALVDTPVLLSSDVYRYLWDGRVQWAGINPYRYPPVAEELASLRDPKIHREINRPTKRTVYPPGAEAAFALVAGIAPNSIVVWRLFLLGCEAAAVALLLGLLRRMDVPSTAVLLYAWAPLAVFEGVQAGHVDFVFLPFILLALRFRQEGRMISAGCALGIAVLIKLYPAVLLLAWWRRGEWRFPAACAATVTAGYLPYVLGIGSGVIGFLPEYFSSGEDFNIGLRFFLTEAIGLRGEVVRGVAMVLLFGLLLAVLLRIARQRRDDALGIFTAAMAAVTAYLGVVPTAVHPWYAVWLLPFLAVQPSAAGLWFTGALSLSYLKYAWQPAEFPFWARSLEFLPFYALLAWEWWRSRGLRAFPLTGLVREGRSLDEPKPARVVPKPLPTD